MHALDRLKRKHGGSIEAVLAHAERCRAEIERLENAERADRRAGGATRRRRASAARELAGELREARRKAARGLEQRVAAELARAGDGGGVARGRRSSRTPRASARTARRRSSCAWRPTPGSRPRRFATPPRAASCRGSCWRSPASAREPGRGTLVFDEIDAGIGGNTARAAGERLRRLGADRQVICITHLPQVASLAEAHFRIEKRAQAGQASGDGRAGRRRGAGRRDRPHARAPSATTRPPAATPASCWRPPEAQLHGRAAASRRARFAHNRCGCDGPQPERRRAQAALAAYRPPRAGRPASRSHGSARLGRRTKHLVKRLDAADVAIIDHADLDRIAAEELIATGVRAVVNVSPVLHRPLSERRPAAAGTGRRAARSTRPPRRCSRSSQDGDPVAIDGGEVRRNGDRAGGGPRARTPAELAEQLEHRASGSTRRSPSSPRTRSPTSARRASCSPGGSSCPAPGPSFRDRHVLIVVRGTTIARTCGRCAPTSATCARCSSGSTAAPTRSWRRG